MLGRKNSLLPSFLSVQWINKPQVPTLVSPALFIWTGTLSNTDDVGSIKSLLRIAVQTSLWAFSNIYLWASHILSAEVTQTGTPFTTATSCQAADVKPEFQLDFGCIRKTCQMNTDCETFLAVPEVGENHDVVWWVFVFHSELLLCKQVSQFSF